MTGKTGLRYTTGPHEFWLATCGVDTWANGRTNARNDTPWAALARDQRSLVCTVWSDLIATVYDPARKARRRFVVMGGQSNRWQAGAVTRGKKALELHKRARTSGLPVYGFEITTANKERRDIGRTIKRVNLNRAHLLEPIDQEGATDLYGRLGLMEELEALWISPDIDALHNGFLYELVPPTGDLPGANWAPSATGDEGPDTAEGMARRILPALVEHVRDQADDTLMTLTYQQLGERIGKRTPQGRGHSRLGPSLVVVTEWIEDTTRDWPAADKPPYLTSIVVRKTGSELGLPSEGVSTRWPGFSSLSTVEKAALVDREYRRILDYGDRWQLVLDAVGLDPVPEPVEPSPSGGPARGWGAGESPQHKALKAFVLANPEMFGAGRDWAGVDEYEMPSGDRIDVHFTKDRSWTGVEVKSHLSDDRDLQRGVYQIVKYRAVLNAVAKAEGIDAKVTVLLATERALPPWLATIARSLDVLWRVVKMPAAT